MKQILVIVVLLFLGGNQISAQDFNTYRRERMEAFLSYKSKTIAEWENYKRKVNADFVESLKKPWERRKAEDPEPKPQKVPDVPPVVLPEIDITIPEDAPVVIEEISVPMPEATPEPVVIVPYVPKTTEAEIPFVFYGTPGSVRFDKRRRAQLCGVDENAVARFWEELSGDAYDNVVADCQKIRTDRDLCDWAHYRMTEKVTEELYEIHNERAVFHAWLLSQSGFSVKLGREDGNLHLLLGTSSTLFGKKYWTLDGGRYFLMDDSLVSSMYLVGVAFPNSKPLRVRMMAGNKFERNDTPSRHLASRRYPSVNVSLSCEKNLLDFLQDIPSSAIDGTHDADYIMYANMPFSGKAKEVLYPSLSAQLRGKSEAESANILLNFVQTAFDYKTDDEVWGRERALFPEETLYYPYSDCEDRAILFCRLVRDLMGLEVAFVSYPGHLATAVCFKSDIPGDYFLVDGKKYLVCDPTYINAPIGRTMPGMDNKGAKVYLM